MNRSVKNQAWLTLALLVLFFILILLAQFPLLAEWFTISLAPLYFFFFQVVLGWLPFSITELVWGALILSTLVTIIHKIRKKAHLSSWAWVMIPWLMLPNSFMISSGMAYQRPPLQLFNETLSKEPDQFVSLVNAALLDFNAVSEALVFDEKGSVTNPYDWTTLNRLLNDQFHFLSIPELHTFSVLAKPMTFSWLYTEFQITGMYFSPLGEVLINTNIPDALIPFTIAHEMAHAKGVMREQDANLIAMYVCLTSNDPFLRYSGYFNTFYALLNLLRYVGDDQAYGRAYQQLSLEIRNDFRYQGTFWAQYTLLDDLARWVNDVYLRIMGNEGVTSYVDVPTTGTVVENGQTIEVITQFSPYQQLYFYLFNL